MWEMICKKGTNESNLWSIVGRRHIHTRQMGSLKSIFRLEHLNIYNGFTLFREMAMAVKRFFGPGLCKVKRAKLKLS